MAGRVLIVGGGASGLMAAITAASSGCSVTVLEQNDRPGRKLLATGNGRCNLTNLHMDAGRYHSDDPAFVQRILDRWSEKDTIAFFRRIGLDVHDRNGWVYPVTDQASSVLSLLMLTAQEYGVKIKTREHVASVKRNGDSFLIRTETWEYPADAVIMACGSPASAVTGSSGDLEKLAAEMGVPCRHFLPALVPLRTGDPRASSWSGVRTHATVTLSAGGTERCADTGEVQLTQNGISGIPVFQISHDAVTLLANGEKVFVRIDFAPEMTDQALADSLFTKHISCPGRRVSDLLIGMLPDRIIPLFRKEIQKTQERLSASEEDVTENIFLPLAHSLRNYTVPVVGPASLKQAQTCSGGIPTAELTENLESRRVPGLFFTGETIDIDGACGGYNLQICWATGHIAGKSASGKLHSK